MIIRLFSVFDPVVGWGGISLNWLSIVMVLTFYPVLYFIMARRVVRIWKILVGKVAGVFKEVSFPDFLGLVVIGVRLFLLMSLNNGIGLFPFVFTGTRHLAFTLSLGLVVWLSIIIIGWMKNFRISSAHLVPVGSPLMLAPFLVLIERVSQLIRPITLSVRLAANMIAGHLIIGLISSLRIVSFNGVVWSVIFQRTILLLEWAVRFIQAFVFRILVLLYAMETY